MDNNDKKDALYPGYVLPGTGAAAPDVGGLTRYDHRGCLMVPDPSGDYYSVTDVCALLATKAAAESGPQQAVPEGDSVQAHVLPPFAAPAGADFVPQLVCSKCGANRIKEPCGSLSDCALIGIAQAVPLSANENAASRGRAQGGITSEESGSDLAHVARQPVAQAERAAVPEGLLAALDELRVVLQMATPSIDQIHEHGPGNEIEKAWQIFYDEVMPALYVSPSPAAAQEGDAVTQLRVSEQANFNLENLVEYERNARGSDGEPPYRVETFYLAADVRALFAAQQAAPEAPACRMQGGICACRSGGSFGGCAIERGIAHQGFASPASTTASASGQTLAGIVSEIHRRAGEGEAYSDFTVTITHGQYLTLCREESGGKA